tara:strand:- start:1168 stop:1320 length:153 start_codon:yes stop_codon:yes gene_type:complete
MLDKLSKFRTWHERQIFGFQDAMRLDDYHMLWFAFGKGVLLTALFVWLCG